MKWLGMLLMGASLTWLPSMSWADAGPGCPAAVTNPQDIVVTCVVDGTDNTPSSPVSASSHTYEVLPTCGAGEFYICYEQGACVSDGVEGLLFDVLRDGEPYRQTCLTDAEAVEQQQVTPGLVLRAFRRLDWPANPLIIEPPRGRTLVNFATNFYTDNTEPGTQQVSLLGQRVTIEATPTTYLWRFGDGHSASTSTPGAAYPDLAVTHDYLAKGGVRPSLATTYTGRYRLNGGRWMAIPETLTVAGTPQALDVIEARSTLVDY